MKSKNHPKKGNPIRVDKFDRKSENGKFANRQKDSKRKLSIYDEFEDEDLLESNYNHEDPYDE